MSFGVVVDVLVKKTLDFRLQTKEIKKKSIVCNLLSLVY